MATALVTGGTSGIGYAFASELAGRGYDLVLVARDPDRLARAATDLTNRFGCRVEIQRADLAVRADLEPVIARLLDQRRPVELLVNNAGFGSASAFARGDLEQLDMIAVHVVASVRLSRAALIHMLARGHGAIVNVASIAAFLPATGNVTYTASKAFLKVFSECLAAEVAGTGVRVQALCPGFTYSEFHDVTGARSLVSQMPKYLWMDAASVVQASFDALDRDRVICVPGRVNRLMKFIAKHLPDQAALRMVGRRSKQFRKFD